MEFCVFFVCFSSISILLQTTLKRRSSTSEITHLLQNSREVPDENQFAGELCDCVLQTSYNSSFGVTFNENRTPVGAYNLVVPTFSISFSNFKRFVNCYHG